MRQEPRIQSKGPIGTVISGVAGSIGLISEGIHEYKARKREKLAVNQESTVQDTNSNVSSASVSDQTDQPLQEQNDEEQWALDDAQEQIAPERTTEPKKPPRDISLAVQQFAHKHPLQQISQGATVPKLAFPVILPQRRPKDRSRGFIRAYAPVLADCGVSQESFLEFLELFNEVTLASHWLQVINFASIGAQYVPSLEAVAIHIAVMLSVAAATEVQGRARSVRMLSYCRKLMLLP